MLVEKGVTRHGFSACERGFADWRELVDFLNEEVRKSREARGEQIVREGLGAQMMQFAPVDVLDRFLGGSRPSCCHRDLGSPRSDC